MGVAKLAKTAVAAIDLRPLWQTLTAKLVDGSITAGEGIDLSLTAQLLGDKPAAPRMRKAFDAFAAKLDRRAGRRRERAA
jgi:hypothetical protein